MSQLFDSRTRARTGLAALTVVLCYGCAAPHQPPPRMQPPVVAPASPPATTPARGRAAAGATQFVLDALAASRERDAHPRMTLSDSLVAPVTLDVFVHVQDDSDVTFDRLLANLAAQGIEPIGVEQVAHRVLLRDADAMTIASLLESPASYHLQERTEPDVIQERIALNVGARSTHRVDELTDGAYSVKGTGIRVGVWDAGRVLTTHQEFGTRASIADGSEARHVSHATHVAGTVAAEGVRPRAMGMAPEASLLAHDWDLDMSELAAASERGMVCSNHSYGYPRGWRKAGGTPAWTWHGPVDAIEDPMFGKYDSNAQAIDRVTRLHPTVSVFVAAGNDRENRVNAPSTDGSFNGLHKVSATGRTSRKARRDDNFDDGGFDTLEGTKVAKNVITVGAIHKFDHDPDNPARIEVSSASSWGPTDDGRIKPDVVASGVRLYSPAVFYDAQGNPFTNKYTTLSGTSMACPTASGIGVLLNDLAKQKRGQTLFSDEMKAVLVHTALSPNPGPSYRIGWGSIRADHAGELVAKDSGVLLRARKRAAPFVWTGTTTGTGPVRATLVWLDREHRAVGPALDDRTRTLVADLDLVVLDSAGTRHPPWRLDPNDPARAATRGRNTVDNVGRVDSATVPAAGQTWKVRVTGPAHTFALAISGLK